MICFPCAKINIGLNVVEKRDDGFHNIETVFYPIGLTDVLEAVTTEGPGIELSSSGLPVPGEPDEHLCVKAYQLIDRDHHLPGISMHLHKIIPIGAGLGGGSSDGAFALNLLDEICKLGLSVEEKLQYAAQLGSDCPFFIAHEPCFATGRGQDLQPVRLPLKSYHLVVVCPVVSISTATAYADVEPEVSKSSLLHCITNNAVKEWHEHAENRFESSIFPKYPELEDVKNKLLESGASYASMSGTGAAVYGIFKAKPSLKSFSGYFTYTQEL